MKDKGAGMEELKPCPFCGGESHLHSYIPLPDTFSWNPKKYGDGSGKCYQIFCNDSDCQCGHGQINFVGYYTKEIAIERWNTHPAPEGIKSVKECNCCKGKDTARTVTLKYVCPRCGGRVGKPKTIEKVDVEGILERFDKEFESKYRHAGNATATEHCSEKCDTRHEYHHHSLSQDKQKNWIKDWLRTELEGLRYD